MTQSFDPNNSKSGLQRKGKYVNSKPYSLKQRLFVNKLKSC